MALQPKFSIITVTYNAESVIGPTLKSVLEQTYTNYEYLLIDGGSKDGTVAKAKASGIGFAHIISERDKGIYDAMNKGIALATGDYLCFLNAGDKLHKETTLQEIAQNLKNENLPDVIYGETAIVNEKGDFLHMRRLSTPEELDWKSFKQGMLVCHQAFLARRTLAVNNLYDLQYRFSADFDWCIRIMKQATYLHNSRQTMIDYLNEGMTTQNHKASLKERFRIMVKHYGWVSTILHHGWFVIRLFYKH
jgi:glycosyltransferase involved in cell wall biosynthesis